jgi:hypothetical protein
MSNTLTLVQESKSITKHTVSFPSYHREKFTGRMFAILDDKTAVSVYMYGGYNAITVASPKDLSLRIQDTVPCEKEVFEEFYEQCQAVITKRIEVTTI